MIFLYLMALVLVVATCSSSIACCACRWAEPGKRCGKTEIACKSLGLNPTIIKLTAFTVGSAFAGFAGSFFASRQGFISPEILRLHRVGHSARHRRAGRHGLPDGVVLAAIVMTVLPELAREFNEYRMLMFGLLMVFMMIWRPPGLLPMTRPAPGATKMSANQNKLLEV
ncbi:ABC transporter permease subunit [Escherichia coli]